MKSLRNEYKYLLDSYQMYLLESVISSVMQADPHTDNGKYQVRSLYFDDYDDTYLFENISGVDARTKYRIRYYNNDKSYISIERKSKIHGMTMKVSEEISLSQAEECFNRLSLSGNAIGYEMSIKNLHPVCIVTYYRKPYVYSAGNVRITFDFDITSSCCIEDFFKNDYPKREIMQNKAIMEVKWNDILPAHIKDIIQITDLRWFAFSKYAWCRTYHL